jgi:threonine synthase
VIKRSDRLVAVLTGHILKDPDAVTRYHEETTPPLAYANHTIEIDPKLSEIERVLARGR